MKSLSTLLILGFVFISLVLWGFSKYLFFPDSGDQTIVSLQGKWKFIPGDKLEFADPKYNDEDWEKIRVPGSWEYQGFNNYDGFAWYRTTFKIKEKHRDKNLYLKLGVVDDVDEVYLNGASIGKTGEFPPDHITAYDQPRMYKIPAKYLEEENVLAVRVFDQYGPGGIVSGDVEIIESDLMEPEVQLSGYWRFNVGDDMLWANEDFDDSRWDRIEAPGEWENQGYEGYDGFAWYRKRFDGSQLDPNEQYVLMMGRIDDMDEVYINGSLIGKHGEFRDIDRNDLRSNPTFYTEFRGYYVPKGVIRQGENLVAVRVFDGREGGGIYNGPIGLVTQDNYTKYWLDKKYDLVNIWKD